MRTRAERRAALLLALAWVLPAAAAEPAFPLKPFRATYAASLNGMPLGVEASVQLANAGDNEWDITLAATGKLINFRETSRFHWQDCHAKPLRYRYEFRGYGVDRKLWLDFDHAQGKATGTSRKGPVSYTVPAGANDELALSFTARCELLKGRHEASFDVATTTGIKKFTFRVDGQEKVKTALGEHEALRIQRVRKEGGKRRSILWVAPALDYTMVKMEHVERLGLRGAILLKTLEGGPTAAP